MAADLKESKIDLDCLVHSHAVLKHVKARNDEIKSYIEDAVNLVDITIYKNHNRFRNDKGFKGLKMLRKGFSDLKKVEFSQCIQNALLSLPMICDLKSESKITYLPVQSNMKYFLIIHCQLYKICDRIHGLCQHSSKYLLYRIKLGHFWDWANFNFANVSRLWTLNKALMVLIHNSYSYFNNILCIFPEDNLSWHGKYLELPKCLLDPEYEGFDLLVEKSDFPKLKTIKDSTDNDPTFEFLGEVVGRVEKPQEEKKFEANEKHSIKVTCEMKKLNSKKDIKKFLKNENELRKTNRKIALTKKLEQNQWKTLKELVKTHLPDHSTDDCKAILIDYILQNKILKKT